MLVLSSPLKRLMEHENDPDVDEPYVPPQGHVLGTEEPPEGSTPEPVEARAGLNNPGELTVLGGEESSCPPSLVGP